MSETILTPTKKLLPLIPLRNVVMFPSVETSLFFGRKESSNSLLEAYDKHDHLVIITAQKTPNIEKPTIDDVYNVGVIAKIEHILQTDGSIHAIIKGLSRISIVKFVQTDPFILAEYQELPIINESVTEVQQAAEALLSQLKKAFALGRQFDLPAMMQLSTGVSSSDLADQVSFTVNTKIEEKQQLLEMLERNITESRRDEIFKNYLEAKAEEEDES